MLKSCYLLVCVCAILQSKKIDYKLITTVRHGIEKNVNYIHRNHGRMNEDCWFGLVLATAIIADSYQNGTHEMDNSSLKLLNMYFDALQSGISSSRAYRPWIVKYVLDPEIWLQNVKHKSNALDPRSKRPSLESLENIYTYQNLSDGFPNSDYCLQDLVNATGTFSSTDCQIDTSCWEKYYKNDKPASGYFLTHKLLLLQFAKARKCVIPNKEFELKTYKLCSLIFTEVTSADYYDVIDDIFDLFLEQVVLCGYEGYTEFFKTKWLVYILKSQRHDGCFPAVLGDRLKTRIKRNINVLPDGCSDHTTGLGIAVLSLYYNFIIKENKKVIH